MCLIQIQRSPLSLTVSYIIVISLRSQREILLKINNCFEDKERTSGRLEGGIVLLIILNSQESTRPPHIFVMNLFGLLVWQQRTI